MADVSLHQLFAKVREVDDFAAVLRTVMEDVASKVDFSHVKSCVAMGAHHGEREIDFARRLLPNLRSFVAVERDPEAVEVLRANLQKGVLPGVETSAVEASVQSWSGPDEPVDAVLMLNLMNSITAADRKALFQKLMTQYVSDGGMVVIANSVNSVPSGYVLLSERLGNLLADYDELEQEMAAVGFRVLYRQDYELHRDVSNPSSDIVTYIRGFTGHSESEARAAIDDIGLLSQPNMNIFANRLGIFTK